MVDRGRTWFDRHMAAPRQRRFVMTAAVAVLLALPAGASATAPWSGSFAPIPDASTTPALPPQSALARIPYAGGYARAASTSRACRGQVSLSLKRGTQLLQRRIARLDRRCHFRVTFRVTREQIGDATQLVVVRRRGGSRTTATVRVPTAASELLGSRGIDPGHVAPAALEPYAPFLTPGLVPG
jgi:hypothetical protein